MLFFLEYPLNFLPYPDTLKLPASKVIQPLSTKGGNRVVLQKKRVISTENRVVSPGETTRFPTSVESGGITLDAGNLRVSGWGEKMRRKSRKKSICFSFHIDLTFPPFGGKRECPRLQLFSFLPGFFPGKKGPFLALLAR